MSRHIVTALKGVGIIVHMFRNHLVKMRFKIEPNRWVCIFIQTQGSRSMLDENVQLAHFHPLQFGQLLNNLCRN